MGNYHISFTFILLLIRMINNLIVKKIRKKWRIFAHSGIRRQVRDGCQRCGGGKLGGVSCVLGNDLADNVVHVDLLQKVR